MPRAQPGAENENAGLSILSLDYSDNAKLRPAHSPLACLRNLSKNSQALVAAASSNQNPLTEESRGVVFVFVFLGNVDSCSRTRCHAKLVIADCETNDFRSSIDIHLYRGQMGTLERFRGCLLGLAVGDAVGTALEFRSPGTFKPITDIVGGGPFGLEAGQWTDDTSMALCLAESLIEKKGFDPADQMERYVKWWKKGHLSCTGKCFDIGNATRAALSRFLETGNPLSGSTDPYTAGNGSIMRLAPLPMLYANAPVHAIEFAAESSQTTHGAATAVDACRYFAALIVGALGGTKKEELLANHFSPVKGYWQDHPLVSEIQRVASGSFRRKEPPQIQGTGYVVRSLEAALWAFDKSSDFPEGSLLAANLGDDADTTAAVYGQLAGAFYGEPGIPSKWLDKLAMRDQIASFADRLFTLSRSKDA